MFFKFWNVVKKSRTEQNRAEQNREWMKTECLLHSGCWYMSMYHVNIDSIDRIKQLKMNWDRWIEALGSTSECALVWFVFEWRKLHAFCTESLVKFSWNVLHCVQSSLLCITSVARSRINNSGYVRTLSSNMFWMQYCPLLHALSFSLSHSITKCNWMVNLWISHNFVFDIPLYTSRLHC